MTFIVPSLTWLFYSSKDIWYMRLDPFRLRRRHYGQVVRLHDNSIDSGRATQDTCLSWVSVQRRRGSAWEQGRLVLACFLYNRQKDWRRLVEVVDLSETKGWGLYDWKERSIFRGRTCICNRFDTRRLNFFKIFTFS